MNNVRKELRLAERHEKKGEKRRRLRSERWRRKFADEVCISLAHKSSGGIDKHTTGEEESKAGN